MAARLMIGTAAWSFSRDHAAAFPGDGTQLERYARVLPAVEINSSFSRPHRPQTYARWAASTPDDFRFALKLPREITHRRGLENAESPLDEFLQQTAGLGKKCGPLLIQLPPGLAFSRAAAAFFKLLRRRYAGAAVCEPRHPSWFTASADALLRSAEIVRAAADPAVVPAASAPGGWRGLCYFRWHGSPRMYWSEYTAAQLEVLARRLRGESRAAERWCIFDNTAAGHATGHALGLWRALAAKE